MDDKWFVINVRKCNSQKWNAVIFFSKKEHNASIIFCSDLFVFCASVYVCARIMFAYRDISHWILFKMMIHCEIGRSASNMKVANEIYSFIYFTIWSIYYVQLPLSVSRTLSFIQSHSFSSMKSVIVIVNSPVIQQIFHTVDHLFRKCACSCELPADYWWKSTKISPAFRPWRW